MSESAPENVPDDERDDLPPAPAPRSWKAPASEDEFNKILEKRLDRERKKYADYDTLKQKAARADALDNELATETEKAVRAAREEERKAVLAAATPRLVKAEFRAAAKGVLNV
jgi:hypothetical protein